MRFEIPIKAIIQSIENEEIKLVAIQLPEGIKRYGKEIIKKLEKKTDKEFILSGYPCYGACDLKDIELKRIGVDKIIHLGHFEIPFNKSIETDFFPLNSNLEIKKVLKKTIPKLKGKKVGILTTPQYFHKIKKIKEFLEKKGFEVISGEGNSRITQRGLVLGCNFSASRLDTDNLLYIGSGEFHPKGVALANKTKVLVANPETDIVKKIDYKEILKKRYMVIGKVKDLNSFGVIISSKKGQMRLKEAKEIKKDINDSSKTADLIAMDDITREQISNLDYEAYVNTSCPRVTIDDYDKFEVPLITPNEAKIAFGDKEYEEYKMDEIS